MGMIPGPGSRNGVIAENMWDRPADLLNAMGPVVNTNEYLCSKQSKQSRFGRNLIHYIQLVHINPTCFLSNSCRGVPRERGVFRGVPH